MNHRLARRRRDVARLLLLSGTALTLPAWPVLAQAVTTHVVRNETDLQAAFAAIRANPNVSHHVEVEAQVDGQNNTYTVTPAAGTKVTIGGPGQITRTGLVHNGAGETQITRPGAFSGVQLSGGTLSLANHRALDGGSGLTMSGGQLRGTMDFQQTSGGDTSVRSSINLIGQGTSTISAASGTTMELRGTMAMADGHNLNFGTAGDTGTVVLGIAGTSVPKDGIISVNGGTLKLGSDQAATFIGGNTMAVNANATFDVNGFNATVSNLRGQGTVTNTSSAVRTLAVNSNGQFDGRLSGNLEFSIYSKDPAGTTFRLTGNNDHSGGTTVNERATLVLANRNALGTGRLGLFSGTLQTEASMNLSQHVVSRGGNIATNHRLALEGGLSGTSLSKTGTGTLALNSATTLTGSLVMREGSLELNHRDSLGSTNVDMAVSGTSVVVNTDVEARGIFKGFAGTTSSLLVANGQTLRFAHQVFGQNATLVIGSNTHAGTVEFAHTNSSEQFSNIRVANGTMRLGSATAAFNGWQTALTLDQGGTLDLNGFGTTASKANLKELNGQGTVTNNRAAQSVLSIEQRGDFSGSITGNIRLDVGAGAGIVHLRGTNTYTGLTVLNGGTLRVSGGAALPDTTTVSLNRGSLEVLTSETVGSLVGGQSSSVLRLGEGATLTAGATAAPSVNYSGSIQGRGHFDKVGSGLMTLRGTGIGADSHRGQLNIRGGTLQLGVNQGEGNFSTSQFAVHAGATLSGIGQAGTLDVLAGGTISPGAPGTGFGTLRVAHDMTFRSGSAFQVNVDGTGRNDVLAGAGRAILAGGIVHARATPGQYRNINTYTILTANGGRTGEFAGVTSDLAFLTPELRHNPNNVQLILTRNDVQFGSVGLTPNQVSSGTAAQGLPVQHPLYRSILGLNAEQARHAFDQISGEAHASVTSALLEDSRLIREAVIDRLRDAPFENAPAAPAGSTPVQTPDRVPAPPPRHVLDPRRTAVWSQSVGAYARVDTDGNAAATSRNTGGYIMGIDTQLNDRVRVGLVGGYTETSFSGSRSSIANLDNYHVGIYGGFDLGSGWMFKAGAAYTRHEIQVDRNVIFPGFSDRTSAKYGASTAQAFGELSYKSRYKWGTIEPFAQVAAVRVSTERFTESGGYGALNGLGGHQDAVFTTLGVRFTARPFADLPLTLKGMVGWRHTFGDTRPDAKVGYRNTPQTFPVWGVPLAKDSLVAELALEYQVNKNTNIGISYSGVFNGRQSDHAVKAYLNIRF